MTDCEGQTLGHNVLTCKTDSGESSGWCIYRVRMVHGDYVSSYTNIVIRRAVISLDAF